jgi:hypothetical protein
VAGGSGVCGSASVDLTGDETWWHEEMPFASLATPWRKIAYNHRSRVLSFMRYLETTIHTRTHPLRRMGSDKSTWMRKCVVVLNVGAGVGAGGGGGAGADADAGAGAPRIPRTVWRLEK